MRFQIKNKNIKIRFQNLNHKKNYEIIINKI